MKNVKMKYATAFISSTFSDMKSERDLIMYNVFPRVKRWALSHGIIFDILDLRWGINDDQAKNLHNTIKICLKRVSECDPLFICLLGDRYGWIPGKGDFNQTMFDRDITRYLGLSATELEIIQALDGAFFEDERKSCIFLFRNLKNLSLIDDDMSKIFFESDKKDKLDGLKQRIASREPVIRYDAEFTTCEDGITLGNFTSEGKSLEDELTERIIKALCEKYGVNDAESYITDDVLQHQAFHLNRLTLTPRIDSAIKKMMTLVGDVKEPLLWVPLVANQSFDHQIAHFINELQGSGMHVLYRFMGIDNKIRDENNLICSLAYELYSNPAYLDDPIASVLDIKDRLNESDERICVVLSGIEEHELNRYTTLLDGLKFEKILIFFNARKTGGSTCLCYGKEEFSDLVTHMFYSKAKVLLPNQLEAILDFVGTDYQMLKITVNYLTTFATYETLGEMIEELKELDRISLTTLVIKRMIEVQSSHGLKDVMTDVLELLCYTPLPIIRDDIVESIYLSRKNENISKEKLAREVDFSLSFAKDFIEEYDSRFKITDKVIKSIFGVYLTDEKNVSPLIFYLMSRYNERIFSKDSSFTTTDAQNYCEILKGGFSDVIRKTFYNFILSETDNFHHLARVLPKRDLINVLRALAIQEMGYSTRYMLPFDMAFDSYENFNRRNAMAIANEKLFSISRNKEGASLFHPYYRMMFSLSEGDLRDTEHLAEFIDSHMKSQRDEHHALHVHGRLVATADNSELFTVYDDRKKAYQSFFAVANKGYLFIIDVFTGEMVSAVNVSFATAKQIECFYCNHTLHLVFKNGEITAVNVDNLHRERGMLDDGELVLLQFKNYYPSQHKVTVQNGHNIKIYHGFNHRYTVTLHQRYTVLGAFLTFDKANNPEKLIVVSLTEKGEGALLLISPEMGKVLDSFTLYSPFVYASQDENEGEIYLQSEDGKNLIIWEEFDKLGLDLLDMKRYPHDVRISDSNIYYKDSLIADNASPIVSTYATRNTVGILTEDNILYCIDTNY